MKFLKYSILFLTIQSLSFAQDLTLENAPNIYLTSRKTKIKIGKKDHITFTYRDETDSLTTVRTITGYIKKLNDTTSVEILPIHKELFKVVYGKEIENSHFNSVGRSYESIETINFNQYSSISHQSNRNRKIQKVFHTAISIIVGGAVLSTLTIKDEHGDGFLKPSVPKALILSLTMAWPIELLVSKSNYSLRPCKNCSKSKRIYALKYIP